MSDPFPPPFHRSFSQRLRSWFFTGLIVFGPIAVTAYIAWWVIDTIDNWVRPWLPYTLSPDAYLPFHVPGFGVVIAIVGLTLLGFLTANFIGRSLVKFGEAMLDRTPLVRGVHKGLKQVFETIFSQSGSQFRKVGLVEFPVPGSWSIVFISSAPAEIIAGALPERKPMISAFMPCTPNPTTGFSSTSRPTRSSNCRFPPTRLRNSSCRRGSSSRKAKRRSPHGGSGEAGQADDGDAAVRRRAIESELTSARTSSFVRRVPTEQRNRRPSLDAVSGLKLCYDAAGENFAANSLLAAALPGADSASDSCDTYGAIASIRPCRTQTPHAGRARVAETRTGRPAHRAGQRELA